jgi:hypothetical protein
MGETSDQIERHIQETRNDLGDNFSELKEKVKTVVDWRAQFEERPGTMMALAFGGGVLSQLFYPPYAPHAEDPPRVARMRHQIAMPQATPSNPAPHLMTRQARVWRTGMPSKALW